MDAVRLLRDRFDYSTITSSRPWTLPKYFEAVCDDMRKKQGVWFPPGEGICECYKAGR